MHFCGVFGPGGLWRRARLAPYPGYLPRGVYGESHLFLCVHGEFAPTQRPGVKQDSAGYPKSDAVGGRVLPFEASLPRSTPDLHLPAFSTTQGWHSLQLMMFGRDATLSLFDAALCLATAVGLCATVPAVNKYAW